MGKKQVGTPRSQVRQALRLLWMRSRERTAALKREGYTCQECGAKQSKRKGHEVAIEVHHAHPGAESLQWEKLIDHVYRHLLCNPEELIVLCKDCHAKEHEGEK